MRSRLRLTDSDGQENQPDDNPRGDLGGNPGADFNHQPHAAPTPPPPAPLSFAEAHQARQMGFPFCQPDQLCDEVLRSLDALSTTLEDLRREIDDLDNDDGPHSAA